MQEFLRQYRAKALGSGLESAVAGVHPSVLEREVEHHVPVGALAPLEAAGLRPEEVFALPSVLRAAPGMLARYRLLLGVSQKLFYSSRSGLSSFKSMEERQVISAKANGMIDQLCDELNLALADLVAALPPESLRLDVASLPFLTLGVQADGAWRGQIGRSATAAVFEAMVAVVAERVGDAMIRDGSAVTVVNSAGRRVTMAFAPDPDVVIRETVGI
ncbi:MAG: XcyI family restriction endonuclease [Bifidobacteriaceae bacterium]|nr:XcyI family restriction endonuclease [Bifidobacteriaceae bacterium]